MPPVDDNRYLLEALSRIEAKVDALNEKNSVSNERLATLEQWRQHATIMLQMQSDSFLSHAKHDDRMHEDIEKRIDPLENTRTQVLFGVSLLSVVGGFVASFLVFLVKHFMER